MLKYCNAHHRRWPAFSNILAVGVGACSLVLQLLVLVML